MTSVRLFARRFISLFLLLIFHLGCFSIPTTTSTTKKRRPSPSSSSSSSSSYSSFAASNANTSRRCRQNIKAALSLYNPWSYLKPIFSSKKPSATEPPPSPSSARSSRYSIPSPSPFPRTTVSTTKRKRSWRSFTETDSGISAVPQPRRPSSLANGHALAWPTCGEVFLKASHVEQHQSSKHAVVELLDGDSAKNVVRIIFQSGWKGRGNRSPIIHRILKIHNSPKILARFEEYREAVKTKASRSGSGVGKRNERCIADGNELLRFHCSTFVCSLRGNGEEGGLCGQEWCSVCGIIKSGFSPKLDGISTMGSSARADEAIPREMEEEFAFMKARRAMLLCRVVAGTVASAADSLSGYAEPDKKDGGVDSVVVVGSGTHTHRSKAEQELLVFNPRAVLPCFVIIYTVA